MIWVPLCHPPISMLLFRSLLNGFPAPTPFHYHTLRCSYSIHSITPIPDRHLVFCSYSILIIPLLLFQTTILFLLLFHSTHSITPIPDCHFMCLLLFHCYHSIIPIPDPHFVFLLLFHSNHSITPIPDCHFVFYSYSL